MAFYRDKAMAVQVVPATRALGRQRMSAPDMGRELRILRLPTRRHINLMLNASLPVLLVVSFLSGWVASLLGLSEFGLHKYSSIAAFAAAGGHLMLHWRSLVAQMRRLRVSNREPSIAAPTGIWTATD